MGKELQLPLRDHLMDRDELFLTAQSWCFANDIVVKYQLEETTSTVVRFDPQTLKKRKMLLHDVRMVVYSNNRVLKKGTIIYNQGSQQLTDAYKNLFIHFYTSRAKKSLY